MSNLRELLVNLSPNETPFKLRTWTPLTLESFLLAKILKLRGYGLFSRQKGEIRIVAISVHVFNICRFELLRYGLVADAKVYRRSFRVLLGAHSSGTGLRPELNFPLPSASKSCSFASKVKRNFRTAGVETRPGETPPFHPGNALPTDEAATFNPNRIAKLDPAQRNETR